MKWAWAVCLLVWMACAPAQAGTVRLSTEDGKNLSGQSYGSGEKGVLLVHGTGRSATDWEAFGARLGGNGFRVLALDLRGHGGSKAAASELTPEDFLAMNQDLDAGVAWLKRQGATSVAVVGTRLGANLALLVASQNSDIHNVVLISPGLNIDGIKVSGPLGAYEGPMLVVANGGNLAGAKAATLISGKAAGESSLEIVKADGDGYQLVNTAPALDVTLVGWLNGAHGDLSERAERNLDAAQVEEIETTGVRYEDRN